MIFSKNQEFSDDQAITATAISTNVIDLGVAGTPYGAAAALVQDVGKGNAIPILAQVTTAFATLTSLTVTVECSASADLSSSDILSSEVIPVASLIAGKQIRSQVVPKDASKRYLGIRYTVTGSNATAGKITAGITMGNQDDY